MPGAYSTDLRERVLVAVEAGEPAEVVAEAFMIGRSAVYRWLAAGRDQRRGGAQPMGGGPRAGGGRGRSPRCPKADGGRPAADHRRRDCGDIAPPAGGEQPPDAG